MMTKQIASQIQKDMEAALAPIAAKYSLKIAGNRGTFDTSKLSVKIVFETAEAKREEFEQWAEIYELQKSDFGKFFTAGGRRFKIIGIKPRSTTLPIIVEDLQGKKFVFRVIDVQRGLKREETKG